MYALPVKRMLELRAPREAIKMKILFTSDIHGNENIYHRFSSMVPDYDCGVIAGDMMEDFLSIEDAIRFGLKESDLLEELHGEEFDEIAELEKALEAARNSEQSINRLGLERKKKEILKILNKAKKPILIVTGNHDIVEWKSEGFVINIEGKRIMICGMTFVGIKDYFKNARSKFRFSKRFANLIDSKTILVGHSPPYKIKDLTKLVDRKSHRIILDNVGSKKIKKLIEKKHPMLYLFGHVHEGFGQTGKYINGGCYRHEQFIAIDTDLMSADYV